MTKKILKGLLVLVILVLVVYFAFQINNLLNPSYQYETANMYTMADSVPCTGIAVRNETIIDFDAVGTLNFRVSDGDKVAKDSVVADVYSSKSIARDVMVRNLLSSKLVALQRATDSQKFASTNLDTVSNQIYHTMVDLSRSIDSGSFDEFDKSSLKALEQLSVFSLATKADLNYDSAISSLTSQLDVVNQDMLVSSSEITTGVGGYFVSYTDGFETLINMDMIQTATPEELKTLLETNDRAIETNSCKVVSNYTWYFAALIDSKYESRFKKGQKLELDLNYALVKKLPVKVAQVTTDIENQLSMILFSCESLNSDITSLRIESGEISFRTYKGIRIPRSAIRVIDDNVGVYTRYDNKVLFKKITYDFENDDFVLANPSRKSDELNLYDEIILEGKDLYDGKTLG